MKIPVTFLVLMVLDATIVLTCRLTPGTSTSKSFSRASEMNTSVDWSSNTGYVVSFLAGFD